MNYEIVDTATPDPTVVAWGAASALLEIDDNGNTTLLDPNTSSTVLFELRASGRLGKISPAIPEEKY